MMGYVKGPPISILGTILSEFQIVNFQMHFKDTTLNLND